MDLSLLNNAVNMIGTLLIHSVWQGVLVGFLYALTMLALGRASPRVRYLASVGWLGVFALAPVATVIWLLPGALVDASLTEFGIAAFGLPSLPDLAVLAPALTSLWLAGVGILGVRLAWHWRRAERLTYLGCHPMPAYFGDRLASLSAQMGVTRRVSIVESVLIQVPTVIGWLKPVILIPSSALLGLTQRQLELVIAHELAHIRRYDYVVNYFLLLMETLFFYHPVVYVIGRGMRNERELCCDDLVVARCGGRVEYITALTDLETLRCGHDVLTEPLSNLAATGGDLLQRVRRIVRGHAPVARRTYLVTAGAALTTLMGTVVMLAGGHTASRISAPDELKLVATSSEPAIEEIALRNDRRPRPIPLWSLAPIAAPLASAPVADAAAPVTAAPVADAAALRTPAPAALPVLAVETPRAMRSAQEELVATVDSVREEPVPATSGVPTAASEARDVGVTPSVSSVASLATSESAGPTFAMKTELHLASSGFGTVSGLKRDASRALDVSKSPYVIIASQNTESDYVVSEEVREEGGALIKRIEPRYPSLARLRGHTDTVQIEFRVTGTGHVRNLVVVSASRPSFQRAVIRAVKEWRYEPLLRDGVPVARTMVETFAFQRGMPAATVPGVGCRHDKTNNTFTCSAPGVSRVL